VFVIPLLSFVIPVLLFVIPEGNLRLPLPSFATFAQPQRPLRETFLPFLVLH
jgi:hypothetical protein